MQTLRDLAARGEWLEEQDAAVLLRLDDGSEYGSLAPVTFPTTALRIRVEIMLGGAWVDISSYVLYDTRVRIARGRRSGLRRTVAATCAFTVKNQDKRFSPRNTAGPYFGLLRNNTPLRVWVNPGSGDHLRFTGKVPSWTPALRGHPDDRWVQVVAYGVRNRLERPGDPPVTSAQYRYLSAQSTLSYQSLETGATGTVTGPPGSKPLPDLSQGGSYSDTFGARRRTTAVGLGEDGSVTVGTDSSWRVEVDAKYPLSGGVAGNYAVALKWITNGAVGQWRLFDDTTGIGLIYNTSSDGVSHFLQSSVNAYDGLWHHYQVDVSQDGADIDVILRQDGVSILSTTIAGLTMGQVSSWVVEDDNPSLGADRMPAVGHVAVFGPIPSSSSSYDAFTGWFGELAAARFLRICGEEGITATVNELYVDAITMGAQPLASVPQLLSDCENACEGLIDEAFDGSLRLSTLRSRYNGALAMTLDYGSTGIADILPPLLPADDDEHVNDWTISRPGGSTGQFVKTTGVLNISEPEDDPLGIGRYADSDEVNVSVDDHLVHVASWRVHRDTVDEPRYPLVPFSLAKSARLIPAWLGCDIGSRIMIANGPDDLGAEDPDEILEGYEETFDQVSWDVDAYLEPASVYRVALISPAVGWTTATPRLDCGGSTLAAALVAGEQFSDNFESGVSAWSSQNGWALTSSTAQAYDGTTSMQMTPPGGTASGGAILTGRTPATAGITYVAEVWFYSVAGWSDARAAVDWRDASDAVISSSLGSATVVPAGVWTVSRQTFTAPALTASAQLRARQGGTPASTDVLWVDAAAFNAQVSVTITDNCLWTHSYGDYPITVDGEDMMVTAVSAATGTYPTQAQTLTVTRSINGVATAHAIGAEVHVKYPIIPGR